jgi:hypothetical protein
MNKLLPLLLLLSLSLKSQYTLTSAFNAGGIGDSYTEEFVDTTGFTILPGGSNVLWNYSGISLTTTTRTVNYVNPASTPKAAQYPGVTVVKTYTNATGTIYENYKVTGSTSEFMGSYGSSTNVAVINYTNTALFFQYPLSYPQTYNDVTAGTYSVPGCCIPNTVCNVTVTADGTGTLALPSSFSNSVNLNCVRIKTETYEQIQVPPGYLNDRIVMYDWYNSSSKFPLMSIYTYTRTYVGASAPPPTYNMRVTVDPNVAAGFKNEQNNPGRIKVFPVPANDKIFVCSDNLGQNIERLELVNTLGQIVRSTNEISETLIMEIENLDAGVYILNVHTGNAIEKRKIVIE